MTWSWLITNLISVMLLPPLSLMLMAAVGFRLIKRRRRRIGVAMISLAAGAFWLLATPWVADRYIGALMPDYVEPRGDQAEAIVVLGGGRYRQAPEYQGDTLSSYTLLRVRYAARLAKQLNKPILVTGGKPDADGVAEGDLMAQVLAQEFSAPPRWVENVSANTFENARMSASLLQRDGIRRIYLVTHAWHLRRAIPEFEKLGFTVVAAGTDYLPHNTLDILDFMPRAEALQKSSFATHEWIGLVWYRLRNLME